MCDRAASEDPFVRIYLSDKYNAQRMCGEAVDDSLAALKFIPDWFVTGKMIKKLFTVLYADDNTMYFKENSGYVIFSRNKMGILDDNNYDEDDPETTILVRLLPWPSKFET